jgi:hypothetical protein
VSIETTLARVAQIQAMLHPVAPVATASAAQPTTSSSAFSDALATASSAGGTTGLGATTGGTSGGRAALAAAETQVGVREQPPGSNDGPQIAQYRQAVAGAPGPGPWCAYFASWAARQAGVPLGDHGQGFARVDDIWSWAQQSGRATSTPQPGDLVVWDEHVGIVESVKPDGSITTVEGNSSDAVSRRSYGPGANGAIGFVRLG